MKFERIKEIIKGLEKVLVAYSGGVDSTFLLKCCVDVLGRENVLAFIGISPSYPAQEVREAKKYADHMGAEYVCVETSEMNDKDYIRNPRERCYYCKLNLFEMAGKTAKERGLKHILEGSNLDDMDDFRPGRRACAERNIVSPILMAKLTKAEVRELSKTHGLPTHDKPSLACLASRIPYGTAITAPLLKKIELSEEFLKSLGLTQVRVRYHGDMARIEVTRNDFHAVIAEREKISRQLKKYGFIYTALDLEAYRTGSMNMAP
ncbi:MAG: ATP-dependent sacrificial sulfur transferase LarE [Syntrophobacterales bacterium]|nr:ATP-dependent sacrificial sulfur transferase LarE [Syntrophobacterales bacterium]